MVASGNRRPSQYHLRKRQKCVLRTLDNLPMKYGSSDSQTLASSYRDLRSAQMDEAKWATKVSGNQLSESRRLFENALKLQPEENNLQAERPRSRYSTKSQAISVHGVPHTGPTLYGSPLYRQDGEFVFPSQRTPSEPPPRYFRAKSPIQKTLERSNSAFRVTASSLRQCKHSAGQRSLCQTPVSFPEFVLIPNEETISEPEVVRNKHSIKLKEQKESKASSLSSEPRKASEDITPVITVEQVVIEDVAGKTAEMMVGTDDRLFVGSVKSNGSCKAPRTHKSNNETKETAYEPTNETAQKKQQLQITRSASKTSSSKSIKSLRSSKSSKGKKEQSGSGEITQQPITEDVNQQTTEDVGATPSLDDANKEDSIAESLTVILRLPDYICPSSEEKSHEARTRHWLHESTFTNADRYVPLV